MSWYKKGVIVIILVIMLFPSFEFLKDNVNYGILNMKNIRDFENNLSTSLFQKDKIITKWAEINKFFKISIYPNKAFYGKNNFIFLGNSYADKIDVYRGIKTYPENDFDIIVQNLDLYTSFFESQGIDFLFTISPNKTTIYPEYLPIWVTKNEEILTPREILSNKINDNELSKFYLDVTPFLTNAKSEYSLDNQDILYYKSDSHWSSVGSNIAFKAMLNKLNYVNKFETTTSEFDFSIENKKILRDLSKLISIKSYKDLVITFNEKPVTIKKELLLKNKDILWHSLYYKHNPNAKYNKVVFLIRDSFSDPQLDYYSSYFSDIYYIHYWNLLNTESVISKFTPIFFSIQPDIVILQMVERDLMQFINFKDLVNYKSIFNSQEEIVDLNKNYIISNFSYNSINLGLELEQTNTNGSISYGFNESEKIFNLSFKLQMNVKNNPEILLQAESLTSTMSQNFYLMTGDNTIYYQFESDEPITRISLIIPEFIDDPIILKEFEIRK